MSRFSEFVNRFLLIFRRLSRLTLQITDSPGIAQRSQTAEHAHTYALSPGFAEN
jgi:hypothetical protein